MADDIAIKVDGVSKTFKLPHEKQSSLKGAFVNIFNGKRTYEKQKVLKDISFEIKKGEFFGIVGRNGSGKSTLLKLLAGIYTPDTGGIQINGKLTPFIELGVGFNPELTGRENVFLNGALLGFNRKEMAAMYDQIVAFAELEKFMDQKLKNYSSGMQVRLAFSIAIQARSDILLIDEVLAVGDLDFQRKCYDYFFDLKRAAKTVILVTHDMSAVRRFCTRSALVDKGGLRAIGEPDKIAEMYEMANLRNAESDLSAPNKKPAKRQKRQGTRAAVVKKVETFNPQTEATQNTFTASEKIGVRLVCEARETIKDPSLGFIFQDQNDVTVFATHNKAHKVKSRTITAGEIITLETVVDNVFTDGTYTITCAIESEDFRVIYDRVAYTHRFVVGGHKLAHATTHPPHQMHILYGRKSKEETG